MGSADNWPVSGEKKSSLSSLDWSKTDNIPQIIGARSSVRPEHDTAEKLGPLCDHAQDLNGFSSSLPALLHGKLNLGSIVGQLEGIRLDVEAAADVLGPLDEELVARAIGDILPGNEDELLAGITEGFDWVHLNGAPEESEDFDLFSSGGGLEMDSETQEGFGMYFNSSRGLDGFYGAAPGFHGSSSNGPGSVIGEHPYGEHPSRTLFVRNINSNVEDSELRALFEQFGDIRTLYTACKHRGFVMISYYDIRAARSAMRALQNKPLRRRKLDIHFSIPKDNPSDKDINQGTLVVFNLDASVSNDDLRQIFGQYGEVKEIRETPHKRHHKFIEFYDVRAAEAALRALNRSDIAGKRIKLEPSRSGGARRSLMQQLSLEPEQDETRLYRQQSSPPVTNSPPGHLPPWGHFGSPVENSYPRPLHHSLGASVSNTTKSLPGVPVPTPPSHTRVGTIGSHLGRNSQMDAGLSSLPSGLGVQGVPPHHAHSLPEYCNSGMPFHSPATPMPIRGSSHGPLDSEGVRLPKSNSSDVSLFENAPETLGMPSSGSLHRLNSASTGNASLSGPQFLWGNSSSYQQNTTSPGWSNAPPVRHGFNPMGQSQPFGYTGNPLRFGNSGLPMHRHHVGSAPSGDPSFLERQFAYHRESPETSLFNLDLAGPMNVPGSSGAGIMNLVGAHSMNAGSLGTNGFFEGGSSPSLSMMSPSRRSHVFATTSGMMMGGYLDLLGLDRGRMRRMENSASQADNKKQYQLDIDLILRGEDMRTTLMIKNIPNKYTSKMLLAAIDENHRGLYDFLYLPIDFKNKCNVGYAFINMTSPNHIIPIYKAFNGKKWEKFNSEKVASLAYARIQGKAALVAHFQNSSLMNEDKRCRPILFNSDGSDGREQELSYLEVGRRAVGGRDQLDIGDSMEASLKAGHQDGLIAGSVGSSSGGLAASSPEKE